MSLYPCIECGNEVRPCQQAIQCEAVQCEALQCCTLFSMKHSMIKEDIC